MTTENDQPPKKKRKTHKSLDYQANIEENDNNQTARSFASTSERVERKLSQLALETPFSSFAKGGMDTNNQINTTLAINIGDNDYNNIIDRDGDDSDLDSLIDDDSNSSEDDGLNQGGSSTKNADNNNDNNGNKSRERQNFLNTIRSSPIFNGKYYTVDLPNSTEKNVITKCNFCHPEKIIKGSVRTTSNFTSHLKRKHPDNFNQYLEYKKQCDQFKKKVSIDRRRWSCVFNQEIFEQNITNFILKSLLPFSTVEDPLFRKIFDDLQIKKAGYLVEHMTRYSLEKRVDEIYHDTINKIRHEIQLLIEDGGFVCTTADVWTGGSRRFLGVTAHWIDSKTLERKSAALACRRFSGTHSHDAIATLLSSIHSSFALTPDTIFATVTDNGSNFVKAFKVLGIQNMNALGIQERDHTTTDEIGEEECSDSEDEIIKTDEEFSTACDKILPVHYRCASHTLNFIASTDILKVINDDARLKKKHESVMRKCTSLWKLLRSPKKRETLKSKLGISIQRPVVTRWNSTFDCFKQLISIKEKLMGDELKSLIRPFNNSDFDYLNEFVECSTPLAEAIDSLQADKCYYGILLPKLVSVKNHMKTLSLNDNITYCKPILRAIISNINSRFENLFDFAQDNIDAVIAAISHPVFKGRWLSSFPKEDQKKLHERFLEAVSKEALTGLSSSSVDQIDGFEFGNPAETIEEFRPSLSQGELKAEITRYLKSTEQKFSIFDNYPTIKKTFLKYNTPLPSSAPVERLFSNATMVNLPKYNKLTDTHFEQRVLAKANATKQVN